jgi:hypothetical protein
MIAQSRRSQSEEELARDGWTRRFVGGPPRLNEFVVLYESLGYEVCLEPQPAGDLSEECGDCTLALMLFRVVYTRRRTDDPVQAGQDGGRRKTDDG